LNPPIVSSQIFPIDPERSSRNVTRVASVMSQAL
jgi:hypothetical protein